MAQEWYLMKSDHDIVSGLGNEDLNSYGIDAFSESLNSSIADDVEICNSDLSVRNPVRAIIQGKVQDTKLNSITRQILTSIGNCKAGDYVFYKKRYWLIVGLVDDNSIYEKGVMLLCNRVLTWLDDNGKINQRWACLQSASQYNNGETSDRFKFVRSDQLMVMTPCDTECLMIKHKQRFIIDKRCDIYEKSFPEGTTINLSKPVLTYELTRTDNTIYDYQDSGHYEFMASQDEQHENDGYYVVDGKGYWLCDNIDTHSVNETPVLSTKIECEEPIVYLGLDSTVFTAKFYDENGSEIVASPQWTINCDFTNELEIEYVDSSIIISANNEKLINKSFELSLQSFGYQESNVTVKIKAFI